MRISLLTGAGASAPLGLPVMLDLSVDSELPANLPVHEGWVLQIARNWARDLTQKMPGGKGRPSIDFELLLTAIEWIAALTDDDPLSIAFAETPDGNGLMMASNSGAAVQRFSRGHATSAAKSLRTKVHGVIHKRLATVDGDKATALYAPLFAALNKLAHATVMKIFTTNYDEAIESIWEDGLQADLGFTCD